MKEKEMRFPIFHVPHDGCQFPETMMSSVCVPHDEFYQYHEKMRDKMVSKVIPEEYQDEAYTVLFSVSRLLCDVERFIGPEELMEQYGMGFCYEKAYDGTVIKTVTEEIKRKTLTHYYRHHKKMDRMCKCHEKILLIDLHSYSNEIVPEDFQLADAEMPDVCIGVDSVFTPEHLIASAEKNFRIAGFSTALNYPYSGCYIPNSVMSGENESDFISVMIEINKRIYLDSEEDTDFKQIDIIQQAIRQIITECTR